jgi:hypothetical protein
VYVYLNPVLIAFVVGCLIGGASIIVLAIAAQRRAFKRAKKAAVGGGIANGRSESAAACVSGDEFIEAAKVIHDLQEYNEVRDRHREQFAHVSKELQGKEQNKL